MNEKKSKKIAIIVTLAAFLLGVIAAPFLIKLFVKDTVEDAGDRGELTGKILEGNFSFDESVSAVKIESGYLYSTEEVLLMEIHVEKIGVAKLAFKKSEEPDIRGAYRYDVVVPKSETLESKYGDSVTVTAEILVTTANETSYRVYSETYTTASEWTPYH